MTQTPTAPRSREAFAPAYDDGRESGTAVMTVDDPFQSALSPSYEPTPAKTRKPTAFATAQIRTNTKAQTFMSSNVQPTFSDPLLQPGSILATQYVPREEFTQVKRSARDAWAAVILMAAFIAGGVYYAYDRFADDQNTIGQLSTKVDSLTQQIDSERGVVISRNKEIQLLNEQIGDLKAGRGRTR